MTDDLYRKRSWRGVTVDERTRAAVIALEDALGKRVRIFQGSYSTAVGQSAGTHSGGGVIDWWIDGVDRDKATRVARRVGWCDWLRGVYGDPFDPHHHAVLRGHRTLSPEARAQVVDYDARGNGLWPLQGGDDPQPYRPDPPVRFSYAEWARERTLRARLRTLGRDIAALKDRRRSVRKRLAQLRTS